MKKKQDSITVIPLEELITDIEREIQNTGISNVNNTGIETGNYAARQYIKFMLEDILLAIPLSAALEIGRSPRITPLPNLPGWVLGVSNIRGEIISIVDLKAFFGMSAPGLKRTQRFIVIHNKEIKTGIAVDRIIGIFSPDRIDKEIQNRLYQGADHGTAEWTEYVSGVIPLQEDILNILDVEKFLSCSRMNAFRLEGSNPEKRY